MAVPALRIPLGLNMDQFNKNVESAKSVTAGATRFIAKQFLDMNASLLATSGAAGSAALGLRSVLGAIAPLTLAIAGIVGVFKLMGYATELAKEKIEEFNETAEKAAKANVSTDFFQRFTKSGEQLKLTVEDVTEALNRFNAVSKDALGGSSLNQEVTKLQGYGNFGGNAGASALASSTDTESKLRATVKLIDEALEKGERLAALDIAEKAFGSKVAANLRQDATYLDQMLQTADKLSASNIVSDEQVAQAIALKTRLEEAEKVLAERFKPIQDDLAKLGVQYHQSWIEIVELMASAVGKANSLYDAIKQIPGVLADLGSASFWTKLSDASEALGLNSRPAGLIKAGEDGFAQPAGFAALSSALGNPNAVRQAMQQATDVQSKVRGDTSKAPPKKEIEETADAYDRALEGIEKHTARLQADTAAVGLGTAALEAYRAEFTLRTAAQQAGIPVEGEVAKRIKDVAAAAGAAGEALAKARVADGIKFGAGTAFLSQEDVAIAQQLKGIYGTDIPAALASSQAAALRLNEATREISSTISTNLTGSLADVLDGTQTAGQAFTNFSKIAIRAIEETIIKLLIVGPLMRSLQSGLGGIFGGGGELPGFGTESFVGPQLAGGGVIPAGGVALVSEHSPGGGRFVRAGAEPIMVTPNDIAPRGGSGGVTVNLIEDSSRAGQTKKDDNGSGGFDLTVFVDSITAKNAANPGSATSQVLAQRGRLASR